MPKVNFSGIVTAMFGLFFIALAFLIHATGWECTPIGVAVAALVVGALGADAIIRIARRRLSFLSRIGPLPLLTCPAYGQGGGGGQPRQASNQRSVCG